MHLLYLNLSYQSLLMHNILPMPLSDISFKKIKNSNYKYKITIVPFDETHSL
jgi:hypothetical protein